MNGRLRSTFPYFLIIFLVMLLTLVCSGCRQIALETEEKPSPEPTLAIATSTTIIQTSPNPTLPIPLSTSTATHTPTEDVTEDIYLCRQPSDHYDLAEVNGFLLNERTLEMLVYAQSLYQGRIDVTGYAITQGSYTNAVEASFSTHAGGGAVDLSVMAPGTYTILKEDIEPLIHVLRLAGFAAWYRDFDDLYDGSPVHIHAIAIGDRDLSPAAREQLTGPYGYFHGYNGLPTENQMPVIDPHGGPVLCPWMIEMGYPDRDATPADE